MSKELFISVAVLVSLHLGNATFFPGNRYCKKAFTKHLTLFLATCRKPRLKNGYIKPDYDVLEDGKRIKFRCDEGYVLKGTTSTVCNSNGRWKADIPSCERKRK